LNREINLFHPLKNQAALGSVLVSEVIMNSSFHLEYDGYWREPNIGGIPAKSGVYTVYASSHNSVKKTVNLKRILYIGESGNVNQRIAGHEKWNSWKAQLHSGEQLCFNFSEVPAPVRERVEASLIFKHKPPENEEYKNSFPFPQTSIQTYGRNTLLHPHFTVYTTRSSLFAQW